MHAGTWRERAVASLLLAVVLLVGVVTTLAAWREVGRTTPGFSLMENLQTGPGGAARGSFHPFDRIVAIEGRPVRTVAALRGEVERDPPGTAFVYTVVRGGRFVDVPATSQRATPADFGRFLLDGVLPGLLALGIGAVVVILRPGSPGSRLFLALCLYSGLMAFGYLDLVGTHRVTRLTLAGWALSPAVFTHLALTFPERRRIAARWPWIVGLPWAVSMALAAWLLVTFNRGPGTPSGEVVAVVWALSLAGLVASLTRTAARGSTSLLRQHARVLLAAFAVGYLPTVTGTALEASLHVALPYLNALWKLNLLFPVAIAYAIVRYQLFDIRAVVRAGTIYSTVTALLVLTYAGLLTSMNLGLSRLGVDVPPLASAVLVSLAVVAVVNPLYTRTQGLLDRVFFRARHDVQRAVEQLTDELTTSLDLHRIAGLIGGTLTGVLHPRHVTLLVTEDDGAGFRPVVDGASRRRPLAAASPLAAHLAARRTPLGLEAARADPALAHARDAYLSEMAALDAGLVAPILFRDRLTGLLVLGPRRAGIPYTAEDARLVRQVASQSAVAVENARAYHALEAALRRVQLLESVRATLSKFVPRAVQALVEQAPDAPALARREADVSVLFVDIAGYTRLSERLESAEVTRLVERYFGAFLDEILARGGDVNETAGDGLMVIFQAEDPVAHARAAVGAGLAIVERARAINAEAAPASEPIALHVGVNSGLASVGATRLEGAAGTRWTYTASGPVTNVAARLAALSADDVVVGAETRRRVDAEFALEDLGERALKNVAEPVRIYRARNTSVLE